VAPRHPPKSRSLDPSRLLYFADRKAWRAWLRTHHRSEPEIWLVYPKKHTGQPRLAYNDAVEEALCFGWIDSTVRRLDADRYAQRFSPRGPKSPYSQANKERLRNLVRQRRVIKAVLATLGDFEDETFEVPPNILAAVRANRQAWVNFQRFSPAYTRIRVAFINGARKRPAEFQKRLRYFLEMTEKNKQFGFGGIERHY
jgi:uncharacterized protein YdeI (YjbR/CyaY-like superfamily)